MSKSSPRIERCRHNLSPLRLLFKPIERYARGKAEHNQRIFSSPERVPVLYCGGLQGAECVAFHGVAKTADQGGGGVARGKKLDLSHCGQRSRRGGVEWGFGRAISRRDRQARYFRRGQGGQK